MERRTFLKISSIGGAALLAGCNSNGESGSNSSKTASQPKNTSSGGTTSMDSGAEEPATTQTGPAQFSDVTIQGPTNVTVGEEFSLPVSVANTGGQNGTFADTLTVAEGSASFNQSVTIDSVQPGMTGNTTVGPLNISSADNYTLALKGVNTTHRIQVNPREKQPGKTITVNDLKFGVDSIRLTPSLFYTIDMGGFTAEKTGTGLISASGKKILCAIRVSLENVGTSQATFAIPGMAGGAFSSNSDPSATLTLPEGSFYKSLPNGGDLSRIQGLKGKPVMSAQLSAGESKSGWLLAQIPRSAATGTIKIGYQATSKNSPPETVWPFPPKNGPKRSLPKFTLDAIRAPGTAELTRTGSSYEISVTNTGNAPGTYRGITQFKGPNDYEWSSYNKQKAKLAPGKSKTFKQPLSYPSNPQLGEAKFRIRPFDKIATVTFDTAKLKFGDTYKAPLGRNVTVSDVQQTNSYTTGASDEATTAEQNQHFIFVRVDVKFVEKNSSSVEHSNLNLVSSGSTYDPGYAYGDTFTAPVQADAFGRSASGPKGSSAGGYLFYKVPKSVTPNNSKIVWSAETPWARWQ